MVYVRDSDSATRHGLTDVYIMLRSSEATFSFLSLCCHPDSSIFLAGSLFEAAGCYRMVPARLLLSLASAVLSEHIPTPSDAFSFDSTASSNGDAAVGPTIRFSKREINKHDNPGQFIAFACLIPILVILSGVFAGLTLGYMSLDETQLNVLSMSGTP